MADFSVSPEGEKFAIPQKDDYASEFKRIESPVEAARREDKEVVVVMGVGFVGVVMAAIIADTVDKKSNKSSKFVIGCQRPSVRSYWKIPLLNQGRSPVKAEDPEVEPMIARCVLEKKTLAATYNSDCLKLADCVVVDVQCDYTKKDLGNMRTGKAEMAALEATIKTIGEKIPPKCLTLIETTVAPGTTDSQGRVSADTACRKMAGWGTGHTSTFSVSMTIYSRLQQQQSTSTTHAGFTQQN